MNEATDREQPTRMDGNIPMPDLTEPPPAIAPGKSHKQVLREAAQRARRLVAETQLRQAQQRADSRAGRRAGEDTPPPEKRNPTTYRRDGSVKRAYTWNARARVWQEVRPIEPTTVAE